LLVDSAPQASLESTGVKVEELIRELEQVRRYAATLGGVLAEAAAKVPDRATGEDDTGAVRVVLDSAGLPVDIDVAADWQRRLQPARLGSAVADAAARATDARVAQWGRSLDGDWLREVDAMKEADAAGRPLATVDPPPVDLAALTQPSATSGRSGPSGPAGSPPDRTRSMDVLAEEALRALDASLAYADQDHTPPPVTAANRDGTVHVSLTSSGLTGCTIDPAWAAGKGGPVLAAAIRSAVTAARARLASVEPEPSPAGEIESLFGEVMALFDSQRSNGPDRTVRR
jgi:hypothetical protein